MGYTGEMTIREPMNSLDGGDDPGGKADFEVSTPESRDVGIEENGCGKEEKVLWRRIYDILAWVPPNCRWDPAKPPQFSMSMSTYYFYHQLSIPQKATR